MLVSVQLVNLTLATKLLRKCQRTEMTLLERITQIQDICAVITGTQFRRYALFLRHKEFLRPGSSPLFLRLFRC